MFSWRSSVRHKMCAVSGSKIERNIAACILNDILSLVILWWISTLTVWIKLITMKTLLLMLAYLLYCCYIDATAVINQRTTFVNNRPIIGILSQEQNAHLHSKYPENYTSYIAASYVKDVESSGARVVPIMIGKTVEYYESIMSKINGVLFPGGATYFNQTDGYADAGQHIFELAQQLNNQGDYFPIFGTCLGFELLIELASGRNANETRSKCYSYENLPLNFVHDFRSSKMLKDAPEKVVQSLANEDVTVNYHSFCYTDEDFKSHRLNNDWRVTSHSNDENNIEFIASVEHKRYPFYGVQFHPEKPAFEWKLSKSYVHSADAVKANRYFMDFFVDECRKNSHTFANDAEEKQYLIYNYEPKYTGKLGSAYEQCFLFEPRN